MIVSLRLKEKIPSITRLATTAIANKIPNVSDLVKKQIIMQKVSETKTNYCTTSRYNECTGKILNAKIKDKTFLEKSDTSGFIDNSDVNKKMTTLATGAELKAERD